MLEWNRPLERADYVYLFALCHPDPLSKLNRVGDRCTQKNHIHVFRKKDKHLRTIGTVYKIQTT